MTESIIIDNSEHLVVNGETIAVSPFKYRQHLRVGGALLRLQRQLAQITAAITKVGGDRSQLLDTEETWRDWKTQHAPEILTLLTEATGRPLEWIDTIAQEHGDMLLSVIARVNLRFFNNKGTLPTEPAADVKKKPETTTQP